MKKILYLFFATMFTGQVWAANYHFSAECTSGQTLYYYITNNTEHIVAVTYPNQNNNDYYYGYTKPSGNLVIPETVTYGEIEYAVTYINGYAFCNCSDLTSIIIPESVTYISGYAFSNCSQLKAAIIPNSVIGISSDAFYTSNVTAYCEAESRPDGWGTNWNYGNVKWNTCATISNNIVFELTSASPYKANTLRYIGSEASVEIPSTIIVDSVNYVVEGIEESTFSGCTELTSVTIPESVKYVGKDALKDCEKLDYLLDGGCCYVGNNDNPFHMLLKVKDTTIATATINTNCKIIYDEAFKGCVNLSSIIIPDSVTCIGSSAFSGSTSLKSVKFNANNCQSAGSAEFPVFAGCEKLSDATFGNKVKSIPAYTFYGCAGLTPIAIPASVTNIGVNAFVGSNFKFMKSAGTAPAAMTEDPFPSVDTVYVPSEKINAYRTASVWKRKVLQPIVNYDITVVSSNNERGIVSGTGNYAVCESVKLTATPAAHYRFYCWTDSCTSNPRIVTVTGNKTYTAKFVGEDCEISFTGTNGSATGIGTQHYGDTITLTATPETGYHFVRWSDGITTAQREIIVSQNASYTAEFEISSFTITTAAENGTVTGGGTYTYGSQATLTATPAEGYRFKEWGDSTYTSYTYSWGYTDYYYQHHTENPRTIMVTEDATYTALFEKQKFTISVIAGGGAMYWNEYSAYYGDTLTITAAASIGGGYRFAGWVDGTTEISRQVVVTQNTSYEVKYDDKYLFKFDSNGGNNIDSMTVSYGSYVNLPVPMRSGYTFAGWQYTRQNGETQRYTGEIEVRSDMEFVALWEKANNTAVTESAANAVCIYTHSNTIIVENATEEIRVYNAMGALVGRDVACRIRAELQVNGAGLYIVKVGNVAKRVMVN